jgi:hypothetical protein
LRVRIDDWNQIVFGRARRLDGTGALDNVEFREIDDVAQFDPFGDRRNEKRRAPFGRKARRDCRGTESVAVGLHHGAALGRRRETLQRVVVARQRSEIDRQTTRHTRSRLT